MCSAHPLVIEAAVAQAVADRSPVLIEATSNQVDQFGGYTGLRPADFRALVEDIARRVGLPTRATWCWAGTTSAPTDGATSPRRPR